MKLWPGSIRCPGLMLAGLMSPAAGISAGPPKVPVLQLYWDHEADAVSPDSMA